MKNCCLVVTAAIVVFSYLFYTYVATRTDLNAQLLYVFVGSQSDMVSGNNYTRTATPTAREKHTESYEKADHHSNITSYHISQCRCLGEQTYTESTLTKQREIVRKVLDFPQMKWMPNYLNPCQNITYPLLERDHPFKENWRSACPGVSHLGPISCLPYVYIGGVQKAGTSDLLSSLRRHPMIFSSMKEPEFWVKKIGGHFTWKSYIDVFSEPSRCIQNITTKNTYHPAIALDDSPGTMWELNHWPLYPGNEGAFEPVVTPANLIHSVTPQARLIAIFRNPVERVYSHFYHRCGVLKNISLCTKHEFHSRAVEAVDVFTSCTKTRGLRECVYDTCIHRAGLNKVLTLRASLYHVFVEDWLRVFPREQIHIVHMETYAVNRIPELNHIFTFLGLSKPPKLIENQLRKKTPKNRRESAYAVQGDMLPETRKILTNFFEPYNQRLSAVLKDTRFLWKPNILR